MKIRNMLVAAHTIVRSSGELVLAADFRLGLQSPKDVECITITQWLDDVAANI